MTKRNPISRTNNSVSPAAAQEAVNVLLELKGRLFYAERDSDARVCDEAIALIVGECDDAKN